jgi:putative acetyltransferase
MITINRTGPDDPDFIELVNSLNLEFEEMYGSSKEKFPGENKLHSATRVIVLYDAQKPVACGALKPTAVEGMAELKRMYVLKTYRGQGLSKMILSALENWAHESGYNILRLKTGQKQVAAIGLYASADYTLIDPYGGYKHIPDSICMEKTLGNFEADHI